VELSAAPTPLERRALRVMQTVRRFGQVHGIAEKE